MTAEAIEDTAGEPGMNATVHELERYLIALCHEPDPRGEVAFQREEVIRRIAALRYVAASSDRGRRSSIDTPACL